MSPKLMSKPLEPGGAGWRYRRSLERLLLFERNEDSDPRYRFSLQRELDDEARKHPAALVAAWRREIEAYFETESRETR